MRQISITGDFDFLQAKIHGLRSRVYESARLDDLCGLRTIAQLWHRLYPESEAADHHALQRRLLADHVDTLQTICLHLPERLAPLLAWMTRRYQVENLKVLLRAWKSHTPYARVEPFLAPLRAEFDLPARALLKATSLADFLLLIPLEEFRAAAQRHAAEQIENDDTFFLETAFDAAYYQRLLDEQRRLPGEHRRSTERLIDFEVVTYNLLCLFRLKLNYGLPFDQVRPFLVSQVPHPVRLERIYDFPHFADMAARIPSRFLPAELAGKVSNVADLERALWAQGLRLANRQFYRATGLLAGVVGFFIIKRVELANLIRVVEGVRYGLGPGAIRQGVVRVGEAVGAR